MNKTYNNYTNFTPIETACTEWRLAGRRRVEPVQPRGRLSEGAFWQKMAEDHQVTMWACVGASYGHGASWFSVTFSVCKRKAAQVLKNNVKYIADLKARIGALQGGAREPVVYDTVNEEIAYYRNRVRAMLCGHGRTLMRNINMLNFTVDVCGHRASRAWPVADFDATHDRLRKLAPEVGVLATLDELGRVLRRLRYWEPVSKMADDMAAARGWPAGGIVASACGGVMEEMNDACATAWQLEGNLMRRQHRGPWHKIGPNTKRTHVDMVGAWMKARKSAEKHACRLAELAGLDVAQERAEAPVEPGFKAVPVDSGPRCPVCGDLAEVYGGAYHCKSGCSPTPAASQRG